jgi:2-dehydro-3-deoxyphosphogluconate aldolase / (4S)-4-hydroxy-2-oxoglutarate aldolase
MNDALERIAAQRVVAVVRGADVRDAVETARACARAGMAVVELTRTTPDVERALRTLRGEGLVLGLGTITNADQVEPAVEAGADFVVSFTAPEGMVLAAEALGVPAIPGALTPTEVARCHEAGAAAVKVFPARAVSPSYLRDLRMVLPDVGIVVTGGIRATAGGLRPWLDAGALAVGLGSDLGTVATRGADEVQRRARVALEVAARVTV